MAKFDVRAMANLLGQMYASERQGELAGREQRQNQQSEQFHQALAAAQFQAQQQEHDQERQMQALTDMERTPGMVMTPELGQFFMAQRQKILNRPGPDYSGVAATIDPHNKALGPWRAALTGTAHPAMQIGPVQGEGAGAFQPISFEQPPAANSGMPTPRFTTPGEQDQYENLIRAYTAQAGSPDKYDDSVRAQAGEIAAAAQRAKAQGIPFAEFAKSRPDLGPSGLGALKPLSVDKTRQSRVTKGVDAITKAISAKLGSEEARRGWTDFITRNPKPVDFESGEGLDYAERWQNAAENFLNGFAGPAEEKANATKDNALRVQWNKELTNLQKPGLRSDDYLATAKRLAGLKTKLETAFPGETFDLPEGMDPTPQLRTRSVQIQTSPKPQGPAGPASTEDLLTGGPVDTQTTEQQVPETDAEVRARMALAAADRATDPKEKSRLLKDAYGKQISLVRSAQFKALDPESRTAILHAVNDTADKLGLEKLPEHIDVGLTPNEQELNKDRAFKRTLALRKQRFAEDQQSMGMQLRINADTRAQDRWESQQAKQGASGPQKWDDQKKALVKEAQTRRNAARAEVKRLEAIPDYLRGVQDKEWQAHHDAATKNFAEAQGAIDDLIGQPPAAAGPVSVTQKPTQTSATRSAPGDIQSKIRAVAPQAKREETITLLMRKYGYTRANAIKKMDALGVR